MVAATHRTGRDSMDPTTATASSPQRTVATDAAATGRRPTGTLASYTPGRAAAAACRINRSQSSVHRRGLHPARRGGRHRLGLGAGGPWLRARLDPDGVHYLVPDPASYCWPGNPDSQGGTIRWWQCTALLRMYDGEQVSSMVAVLPETFTAVPSTLTRRKQVRLVHRARATERGTYLWGRDHKTACDPQLCGYNPEAADHPPPNN